jgi:hypothetical protein
MFAMERSLSSPSKFPSSMAQKIADKTKLSSCKKKRKEISFKRGITWLAKKNDSHFLKASLEAIPLKKGRIYSQSEFYFYRYVRTINL